MNSLLQDSFGSSCTGPTAAMTGINDFAEGFVGFQPRAANVLAAADAFPDSAMANIYAGILWMFLERPEAPEKSIPYALRAEACGGLNRRETGLLSLLKAWQVHDYRRARQVGEQLCQEFPGDLPTLKVAQYHAFNIGDANTMLKLALAGESANAHHAAIHSVIAFAYEELNQIDEAEQAAYKSLSINSEDPWAHHALAHVHLSRGTVAEGLQLLSNSAPGWNGLNSFMFTHNWWHIALFELAQGNVSKALSIYDDRCWGVEPDYSQDQIGAVSLLARLELADVDIGERWNALLPYLETRQSDVVQPFLSLQYLYGLAKAKSRKAQVLLALIQQQAESPWVAQDRSLWVEVGIPAANGLVAHAEGDHELAARELASVRSQMWRVGGSHAQRDFFEQLLLDARLKSGQWELARKTLEHRRQWEPESPILQARLSDVYSQLKL